MRPRLLFSSRLSLASALCAGTLAACAANAPSSESASQAAGSPLAWSSQDLFQAFSALSPASRQKVDSYVNALSMTDYYEALHGIMADRAVSVDGVTFTSSLATLESYHSVFVGLGQKYGSYGAFALATHQPLSTPTTYEAFKASLLGLTPSTSLALEGDAVPEHAIESAGCTPKLDKLTAAVKQSRTELGSYLGTVLGCSTGMEGNNNYSAFTFFKYAPDNCLAESPFNSGAGFATDAKGILVGKKPVGYSGGETQFGIFGMDKQLEAAGYGPSPLGYKAGEDLLQCYDNTPVTNPDAWPTFSDLHPQTTATM